METATYIFSSDKLAAAVKAVAGVIPGKRCNRPILHNLRLRGMETGGIEAFASDLETAVIVRVGDCDGEMIAETLVPVETAKAIGKAKGDAMIVPNGETIDVLGARVPVDNPMEYPVAPAHDDSSFAAWLPFEAIRRIDDHIANATDDESIRYALGGILLERRDGERLARAVGTDGRRLHVLTVDDGGVDALLRERPNHHLPRRLPGSDAAASRSPPEPPDSQDANCPTRAEPCFSSGNTGVEKNLGAGLAFRPTLGILRA